VLNKKVEAGNHNFWLFNVLTLCHVTTVAATLLGSASCHRRGLPLLLVMLS
jgi:hypothetical protein